jgi:hypothetical protein
VPIDRRGVKRNAARTFRVVTPKAGIPWIRPWPGVAIWLVGFLAACSSITDVRLPVVESIEAMAAGPLAQRLEIALVRSAPVAIEYWSDDTPRLRVASSDARTHAILLARLHAGRTYRWSLVGTRHEGVFETEPLPADLAGIRFRASGSPTTPLVMLPLFQPVGFRGWVAIDGAGRVAWYWRAANTPFSSTRRANGNFVFLERLRGLVEVTPEGTVASELATDTLNRDIHHDAVATPDDTILFIAFDEREHGGQRIKGEAIWEWWPETGAVVRRWSSWDHLAVDLDRGPRFDDEWLHANALSVGPRRNVLVSLHYLNQVLSIAADWQSLEWRLGGVNATIRVPDEEQFSGQHSAREVAPGRVVLFDNRFERGGYSRAVEFELGAEEAVKRWEWIATPRNFAAIVSTARRLPNGNTLVGFGVSEGVAGSSGPVALHEVTPDGQEVWRVVVDGVLLLFRAEPIGSIAGETVVSP